MFIQRLVVIEPHAAPLELLNSLEAAFYKNCVPYSTAGLYSSSLYIPVYFT
jgi:hypothetical protein